MIITDKNKLKSKLEPRKMSKKDIDKISEQLLTELKKAGGLGLSANQIGLTDRVCLVNVTEPLILVNPRIVEVSKEAVAYVEQCLSLPKSMKKPVKTVRYKRITVECDNLGKVVFEPSKPTWESAEDFFSDEGMLECVCAQHEIDHLNGILITDNSRRYTTTVTKKVQYSRNEKVMVKMPDGSTEFMKYKKAEPLLEMGAEIL